MSPPSNQSRPARRRSSAGRLLTQQQAATLAGCSRDTIARARRTGRFPHARLVEGRWMIPADDLDDAGFVTHPAADVDVSDEDDQTMEVPVDLLLTRAEARIAALEDVVARQDAELTFLRRLAADTVAKRAG